jgi:hypothetical protein
MIRELHALRDQAVEVQKKDAQNGDKKTAELKDNIEAALDNLPGMPAVVSDFLAGKLSELLGPMLGDLGGQADGAVREAITEPIKALTDRIVGGVVDIWYMYNVPECARLG